MPTTHAHPPPLSFQMVSFWRPVPPMRNYKPLGDVVVLGTRPPDHPVPVFRNDAVLHDTQHTV